MKILLKISVVVALVGPKLLNAQSQKQSIDFVLGTNFQHNYAWKPKHDGLDYYNNSNKQQPGLAIGINYRLRFSPVFSVQTGLLWECYRNTYSFPGDQTSGASFPAYKNKNRGYILQLPLLLQVHTPTRVSGFLNMGASLLSGLGNTTIRTSSDGQKSRYTTNGGFGNFMSVNGIVGLGVRMPLKENIQLSAEFRTMTDVSDWTWDQRYIACTHSVLLGIGYSF